MQGGGGFRNSKCAGGRALVQVAMLVTSRAQAAAAMRLFTAAKRYILLCQINATYHAFIIGYTLLHSF